MNQRIGSVANSIKGRLRLTRSSCRDESLCWSYWHHHLGSPVCLRRRAALRLRMVGAYVSLTVSMRATHVPARTRTIQVAQRHPMYWKTKPPMMGPVTGPLKGATAKSDMVLAR